MLGDIRADQRRPPGEDLSAGQSVGPAAFLREPAKQPAEWLWVAIIRPRSRPAPASAARRTTTATGGAGSGSARPSRGLGGPQGIASKVGTAGRRWAIRALPSVPIAVIVTVS